MKCVLTFALCVLCLSVSAAADDQSPTAQPDNTCCGFPLPAAGTSSDNNWLKTHTPEFAPTVGNLYDAGTSLRSVPRYFLVGALAAYGGAMAAVMSIGDESKPAKPALVAVGSGLEVTALYCLVAGLWRVGRAGDRLHRAALGQTRLTAQPSLSNTLTAPRDSAGGHWLRPALPRT